MIWDKRSTQRRPDAPPPDRSEGADIIYLGIADDAREAGVEDVDSLRIGDSIRLMPDAAMTFGRSSLCDVVIDSSQLSRTHALLSFMPGPDFRLALVDLGSRNGVWVDGQQAPVHILAPGDALSLARCFRFRCQPVSRSSTEVLD